MNTVIVTGSAGLIGSECFVRFASEGFKVVGIDNDLCQSHYPSLRYTYDLPAILEEIHQTSVNG